MEAWPPTSAPLSPHVRAPAPLSTVAFDCFMTTVK